MTTPMSIILPFVVSRARFVSSPTRRTRFTRSRPFGQSFFTEAFVGHVERNRTSDEIHTSHENSDVEGSHIFFEFGQAGFFLFVVVALLLLLLFLLDSLVPAIGVPASAAAAAITTTATAAATSSAVVVATTLAGITSAAARVVGSFRGVVGG